MYIRDKNNVILYCQCCPKDMHVHVDYKLVYLTIHLISCNLLARYRL